MRTVVSNRSVRADELQAEMRNVRYAAGPLDRAPLLGAAEPWGLDVALPRRARWPRERVRGPGAATEPHDLSLDAFDTSRYDAAHR